MKDYFLLDSFWSEWSACGAGVGMMACMYFLLDLDEKMSMKGSRRYFRMALCTDRVQVDAFP